MLAVGACIWPSSRRNPQHVYLLRLVDPPKEDLPFPDAHVVVDRGPFSEDGDLALMRAHQIELVVSKNAGVPARRRKSARRASWACR